MNTNLKKVAIGLSALGLLTLVACQSMEKGTGQKATASLDSRSGSKAKGQVDFTWQGNNVLINGTFSGLKL